MDDRPSHGLSAIQTALTEAPPSIEIVAQFRSVAIATPQVQILYSQSSANYIELLPIKVSIVFEHSVDRM